MLKRVSSSFLIASRQKLQLLDSDVNVCILRTCYFYTLIVLLQFSLIQQKEEEKIATNKKAEVYYIQHTCKFHVSTTY